MSGCCWARIFCNCSKSRPQSLSADVMIPPASVTPVWLDAQFVQKVLRNELGDSVVVHNVNVEAAVAAGENYSCNVYRVEVEASSGPMSLIFKCMPENEERALFVRDIMSTEMRMYERTLPLLRAEEDTPKYPFCYYTQKDGVTDLLALQDLRPRGFRTRPRHLGLDVAHCRLALKELAHLHGFSAALRAQDPDKFTQEIRCYTDKLYNEQSREKFSIFLASSMKMLADAGLNKLPMRFHDVSHLIAQASTKVFDLMMTAVNQPNEDSVLVLNHGDFWCNNMMFEYAKSTEEPAACALIDFQICRYAPPVFDIMYFLYTSTDQAMRREHGDELLQLYLNEARWAMKKRGLHHPNNNIFYSSLDELKKDMVRHATFGFFNACLAMPLVLADENDVPDLDSALTEDLQTMSPFARMYSRPLFCRRFKEILEDFDDIGFFEELRSIM